MTRCRGCRAPHHLLRLGLCPRCERERVAEEGAERAREAQERPATPPPGAFSNPCPPEDLFDDE